MTRGRRDWIIVGLLLTLALVTRLVIASLDHVLQGDEGAYLWLGKTLVTGGGYTFFGRPEMHYTPLYPLVTGLIWLLTRSLETATKVCFVLFGVLSLIPVYFLSRDVHGRLEAYSTLALLAVLPARTSYVFYWGSMTEPLYFCVVFGGAYAGLLALRTNRWPAYAAAGALFSLAYLTRPEGLVFMLGVWAFLALRRVCDRRSWQWQTAGKLGLMLGAFLVVALPYLIYLHNQIGHWTFSGKTWMAYMQLHSLGEADEISFDKVSWGLDSTGDEVMYHSKEKFDHTLGEEIRAHPAEYLSEVLGNIRQLDSVFLSKRILPFFLLPLIGLALFRGSWDRRRLWDELYLLLLFSIPILSFLPFGITLRYILGTMFILMMWIGRGLVDVGYWLAGTVDKLSSRRRNVARWAIGTTAILTVILVAYYAALQPAFVREGQASMHFNYKRVGEWLEQNSAPDATIMSRGAIVAIHANRNWEPFPHASYEEVIGFARRHDVDYLVVNRSEFEVMRPHLAFLADPAQTPPGLERVFDYEDQLGTTAVLRLRD